MSMHRAFPDAPIFTSLYLPTGTFPEFADADVRPARLDRIPLLRHHHRLALPVLARTFSRMRISSDVVLVSSSGWAHGVRTSGVKIVYYYTPARWLYQSDRYLGERAGVAGTALAVLRPALVRWDKRAAATATHALTLSRAVAHRIKLEYGIDAELLPPPPGITADGAQVKVEGVAPGFHLCVSRLLPYKNVGDVVKAFALLPEERLVVVGQGPERGKLQALAPRNVVFLEHVTDGQLRWLYAECCDVLAAAYEDFGLTPSRLPHSAGRALYCVGEDSSTPSLRAKPASSLSRLYRKPSPTPCGVVFGAVGTRAAWSSTPPNTPRVASSNACAPSFTHGAGQQLDPSMLPRSPTPARRLQGRSGVPCAVEGHQGWRRGRSV